MLLRGGKDTNQRIPVLQDTTKLYPHLVAKPSSIPNAGDGLFTSVTIPSGVPVARYYGDWVDSVSSDYCLKISRSHFIDAEHVINLSGKEYPLNKGRYVNDVVNSSFSTNLRYGISYSDKAGRDFIVLYSTRSIAPGEELFVSYGGTFWRTRRKK